MRRFAGSLRLVILAASVGCITSFGCGGDDGNGGKGGSGGKGGTGGTDDGGVDAGI